MRLRASRRWAAELLHFWFHRLSPADWFGGGPQVDAELERRFGPELHALGRAPAASFMGDPGTRLAAVLLFDQIPRNLYRDTAAAFAWDPLALALARSAIVAGLHHRLPRDEAKFLGMPLMHSEAIADQRASLRYFAALGDAETFAFARSHRRMIARFGRFPHRNAALGRSSASAERAAVASGFDW